MVSAVMALLFLYIKPAYAEYTPVVKKKTVTLTKQKNKIKKMTVKAGTIINLKAKYKKKTVDPSKIKYTSSKKKVASVSQRGVITTKKAGKVTIKLKRKKKKQYGTLSLTILPRDPIELIEEDEDPEDQDADTDIKNAEPAKAYSAQTSAFCAKHTHKWKAVEVENYPAEYCTVCRIERWIGSDELKGEAVVSTSRKFIMIGDSYGARSSSWGGNYTWPYQLCKYMGLGKGQCYISAKGGYGFGAKTTAGTGYFSDLLRLIDPDPEVTDIIIVGGIGNDQYRSKVEIQKGFIDITMEAFVRFPNARIIYAAPNCHISDVEWQSTLDTRRPWYKSFCLTYGWLYLDGCEKILPRESIYFRSDGHHPNMVGEEILGEGLINIVKRYI